MNNELKIFQSQNALKIGKVLHITSKYKQGNITLILILNEREIYMTEILTLILYVIHVIHLLS